MAQDSIATLLNRAIARLCPVCGHGAIMASHLRLNRACPNCHAIFHKEPGDSLGAIYLDFATAAIAFMVSWAVLDTTKIVAGVGEAVVVAAIAILSAIASRPYTRSVWLAMVCMAGGIERPHFRVIRGGKDASGGRAA